MMAFLSDLDLKIIMIFLQGEIILPYPQLSLQKHNPIWPSITKWKFIPAEGGIEVIILWFICKAKEALFS